MVAHQVYSTTSNADRGRGLTRRSVIVKRAALRLRLAMLVIEGFSNQTLLLFAENGEYVSDETGRVETKTYQPASSTL